MVELVFQCVKSLFKSCYYVKRKILEFHVKGHRRVAFLGEYADNLNLASLL